MRRPRFIAEHARNARGLLGRTIAFMMARETWSQNLRVIQALGIDRSDHILDLGCGHGRSLTELAVRASIQIIEHYPRQAPPRQRTKVRNAHNSG